MKVLVIGAGKVGYQIAESLSKDNHDVVVLDQVQERLEKVEAHLDVLTVRGNGLSVRSLEEAKIRECELLIAVTDSDEVNIVACTIGKKFGARKVIARIRDPQYAEELGEAKDILGLDLVINPEKAAANEIVRLLTITPAIHVEDFAKGRVRMVEISVAPDAQIAHKKLKDLDVTDLLVTAILRKGEVIIPSGEDAILPGDYIFVIGRTESMNAFYRLAGKSTMQIKNVMILGGSRVAVYLARRLTALGIKTKIIEQNEDRCQLLAEQLPNVLIIEGDGSDVDTLQAERISEMDGFVAVTGIDEENLVVSLLAKQLGAKKTIAKVSRSAYTRMVETLGVDAAVSPRMTTANAILRYVRGGRIVSMTVLEEGKIEVLELIAQAGSEGVSKPLKHLGLPKGIIIGSVVQKGKAHIPTGEDQIQPGNRVIVFTLSHHVKTIQRIFSAPEEDGGARGLWSNLKNLRGLTGR